MITITLQKSIYLPSDQFPITIDEYPQLNTDEWDITNVASTNGKVSVINIDGSTFTLKPNVIASFNDVINVSMHNNAQAKKRNDYVLSFNLNVTNRYIPADAFKIKNIGSSDITVKYGLSASNNYCNYYIGDIGEVPATWQFHEITVGSSFIVPSGKCLFLSGGNNTVSPRLFITAPNNSVQLEGNAVCMLKNKTISSDGALSGFLRDHTCFTSAPELPATQLSISCYKNMYAGCSKLVTPMSELPAGRVYAMSYESMFDGCSSMTSTPTIKATTASKNSFRYMFYNCSSITETAKFTNTLTYADSGAFDSMYAGCTNLRKAYVPLASKGDFDFWSYRRLFYGCGNLTEIHNGWNADPATVGSYFDEWLAGVPSSGTYYYNPNTPGGESRIRQYYGIPSGWTLIRESHY